MESRINSDAYTPQDIRKAMHFIAAAVTSYVAFPFGEMNYEMIAEDLRELSGADYVVFTVSEGDGTHTATKAVAGLFRHTARRDAAHPVPLIGRRWAHKGNSNSQQHRRLVRLGESTGSDHAAAIPRDQLKQFSALFRRDNPYAISIHYGGRCLGDFLIYVPEGEEISDPEPVELFANQIGTLLLRKQTEEHLQRVNREYETVYQGTHDAMMLVHITEKGDFRCLRTNQSFAFITGISAEQAEGKPLRTILGEKFGSSMEAMCRKCADTQASCSFEEELHLADKTAVFHTVLNPVNSDQETVQIISSSRDITELKQKEAQIRHLSIHDSLTGFFNRTQYFEALQAFASPEHIPLSVIFADVNGLKLVNDAFGHALGDQLIRRTAQLLSEHAYSQEQHFRIGGDEFVLLIPRTDEDTADRRIQEIRSRAQQTFVGITQVSLALGSCTRTSAEESLDSILQRAEAAMYTVKLTESRAYRSSALQQLMQKLRSSTSEHPRHTETVRKHAVRMGNLLGLSGMDLEALELLGTYHDIGKITVDPEVLNKPNKLEYDEQVIIRRHCEVGYRIAVNIQRISTIAEDILTHHERWDGTGYPQGLSGREIPLRARIIALCDAYTVMTQGSFHKQAVSRREALNQISRLSGKHFDPDLAQLFIQMVG